MKYQTLEFATAQEAVFDAENHRVRMTLVRPGVSKNKKNWTPQALKKAVESGVFNGSRMYDEHAKQKGNRPLKELISVVETTSIGEDGRIIGDVKFVDLEFEARAQRAPEHFGASIDVLFRGKQRREGDGTSVWDVDEIVHANSVDWTGNPAAGGGIERFLTAQESEDDSVIDWSKVTLDDLRKNRPDLEKELQPAAESGSGTPPASGITEDRVAAIVAEALRKDREEQQTALQAQEAAAEKYDAAIKAAPLPDKTKLRLTREFRGAKEFDENAVKAAIQEAQEEAQAMGWKGPQIKGLGASATDGKGEASRLTVEEAQESAPAHAALLKQMGLPKKSTAQEGKKN